MTAPLDARRIATCYRAACELDVQAFKPGNVSVMSPAHDMQAEQFLISARRSADAMSRQGLFLGQRILDSVTATHRAVGCNTNLGIILLIAPLVQAHFSGPVDDLAEGVRRVLSATTLADTDAVYRAIQLASPGGLGVVEQNDVADGARVPLTAVMRDGAAHDLIARQYANEFTELLDDAVPYLEQALRRHPCPEPALTDLFLYLLARYPDTHIRRKHGMDVASQVSATAVGIHKRFLQAAADQQQIGCLVDFDGDLKRRGINPGTTADFCVAAFFIHRLTQATTHTGTVPDNSRTLRPKQAEAPHLSSSQAI